MIAITIWAREPIITWAVLIAAVKARQHGWQPAKMQDGSIGDRSLGDYIPIELDGIINDAGELPNHQIKVGYAFCFRTIGMTEGYF